MIKKTEQGYVYQEGEKVYLIRGINAANDINGNHVYKVFLDGFTRYTRDCSLPYNFYKKWYKSMKSLYASNNYGLPEGFEFVRW